MVDSSTDRAYTIFHRYAVAKHEGRFVVPHEDVLVCTEVLAKLSNENGEVPLLHFLSFTGRTPTRSVIYLRQLKVNESKLHAIAIEDFERIKSGIMHQKLAGTIYNSTTTKTIVREKGN